MEMNPQVEQQISPPRKNDTIDESGNVDRIRQILFGSQLRDYDDRFQKLEERLLRELGDLRGDLHRQLQGFVFFIRGEVESISNRVATEQAERVKALRELAEELGETIRNLDSKVSHLDGREARARSDLRDQLLGQIKALSEETRERHDRMKGLLDEEAGQIRHAMTDRDALAELFKDVALRLKNEFRAPEAS